jgi:hypothetical protein
MTETKPDASSRYDLHGGWDEKREHPDGFSYWRNGERHRADGFAVFRDGQHEVWLFGHPIETPSHPTTDPLYFTGQSKTGKLSWADAAGNVRAVVVTNAAGIQETRWYDALGDPEAHWAGGYHVLRLMSTGERRFYKQSDPADKPQLHRLDGPAIEDASSQVKSIWCEDGAKVHGILELLIRHTVRAQQAVDHDRPMVRLDLTDREKARIRITVINFPDSDVATDCAIAFPDEYHAAMIFMNEAD